MGGSQRRHGMAHGAVGEHHGSWGAGKCRSTQGRVDGEFSYQERCLRLALPSAGSAVGGRLDRHRADSRRAVAPAERGPARALGASKRHKPREWPRSGVQPQRYAVRLSREKLFFSEIPGLFMGMEQFLTSSRPAQYFQFKNSDGCAMALSFSHRSGSGSGGRWVFVVCSADRHRNRLLGFLMSRSPP